MERIDPQTVARYLENDVVAALRTASSSSLRSVTSQRWLDDSAAKRLIFHRLYGDVLQGPSGRTLLDVGGGLTMLTPRLADHARYTLLDPLFHETEDALATARRVSPPFVAMLQDWGEASLTDAFDLVVANDIFPNVDQRLALFLEWAIPRAREVRLSLTFYNTPRFYRSKRIDADEHLIVLAFDGARTLAALAPFADRIEGWRPELFEGDEGSCFPNGRQVVLARIKGQA